MCLFVADILRNAILGFRQASRDHVSGLSLLSLACPLIHLFVVDVHCHIELWNTEYSHQASMLNPVKYGHDQAYLLLRTNPIQRKTSVVGIKPTAPRNV